MEKGAAAVSERPDWHPLKVVDAALSAGADAQGIVRALENAGYRLCHADLVTQGSNGNR